MFEKLYINLFTTGGCMGSVNQTISRYSIFLYQHQTVSGKTSMISFISEIFLFQIYPSVQGQIFGRSSISFNGCDRNPHNKLMAVICRFDRLFSTNSFITVITFRLFQIKISSKIWPISDQNMVYLYIDPKVSTLTSDGHFKILN